MVHVERQGPIVIWTIDRPEARNALDRATFEELLDRVREAALDRDVRAGVLTSRGHMFVAGADLRELHRNQTPQGAELLSDLGYALTSAIVELPFPVIAALPGPAIGGGAELALACDLRVADVRAHITFKHVRMGVTTSWGTLPRLVALVGTGAAARLLYTAHELTAAEGKLLGLVNEVTENGLAIPTALAWASDIALGSPKAIAEMKRLFRASTDPGSDVRALERRCFIDTASGPDHRDAVEAFFERRPPQWARRD